MPRGPPATRAPGGAPRACGRCSRCSAPALVALVSALLLWLGWLLVGGVANAVPALPPGSRVRVGGARRAGRAGQRRRGGRDAGGGAARRADRLPARGAGGGGGVVVAGRAGARARCTRSPRRRDGCRSSRWTPGWRCGDARGEVAELAAGFDAMLDRLQAAFDAQRRFVANASHELRTPLAVLRTEVDVTLADPDADVAELRRMGEVVRDATRRADELIAGLLLLARTEAPSAVDPAAVRAVDLADVVVPAAGRGAGRGRPPRAADQRAPRTGADGGRPGAARAGGREPRGERGAAQRRRRAGWRSAPALRGPVRRAARQLRAGRRSPRTGWRSCSSRSGADRSTAPPTRRAPGWGSRSSGRWCTPTAGTVAAEPVPGGGPDGHRAPAARPRPTRDARAPAAASPSPRRVYGRVPAGARSCGRRGSGAGEARSEQRGDQADLPLAGAARPQRAGDVAVCGRGPADAAQQVGLQQVLDRDRPLLATAPRCRRGRPRAGRPRPGRGRPSGRRAGGRRSGAVGVGQRVGVEARRPAPAPRTSRR